MSKARVLSTVLAATLLAAVPAVQAQSRPAAPAAQATGAASTVMASSTRIIETLQTRKAEFRANRPALRSFIDGELNRGFDRDYAARLVLGRHARGATDAQISLFANAMADNLMARYGDTLLEIDGKPRFRLKGETALPGGRGFIKVSTELLRNGAESTPVEYLRRDDRRHLLRADLQEPVRCAAAAEGHRAGGSRTAWRQPAGRRQWPLRHSTATAHW